MRHADEGKPRPAGASGSQSSQEDALSVALAGLISAAPSAVEHSIICLLDLANEFPARETRVALPATSDGIVEDAVDDSVEFKVLDALRSVLDSHIVLCDDAATSKTSATILRRVLMENSDRLRVSKPIAVRLAASRCIGISTRVLLKDACDLFVNRLRVAQRTEDGAREFVPVQFAVRWFEFGVATEMRAAVLVGYLKDLAKATADLARGVLRRAVCLSLGAICERVIRARTGTAAEVWPKFARSEFAKTQFWPAYAGA